MGDIGFYVTHIYAGENYLSCGPHDKYGKPAICQHIMDEWAANAMKNKLNNGETEFRVDRYEVNYCNGKLKVTYDGKEGIYDGKEEN